MKVVLIDPSDPKFQKGVSLSPPYLEPLALGYLGAYAEKYGHGVEMLQQADMPNKMLVARILQENPQVVAFSPLTFSAPNTLRLCSYLKQADSRIKTIAGGYHASGVPEMVKDKSLDFVVIGEGEKTFAELLCCIDEGEDPSFVKGIAFWDNRLVKTEPRERIRGTFYVPLPIRKRELMRQYRRRQTMVSYSRGCRNACPYCSSSLVWGREIVWRDPADVVDEIDMIADEYHSERTFFTDLNLYADRQKAESLCNELIERGVKIGHTGQGNLNIDNELLRLMKNAGFTRLNLGIESVSPAVLKQIGRKASMDRARDVLREFDEAGLISRAYFMIGYPGETEEDYGELAAALEFLQPDYPRFSFFTPFPGTKIFEMYKEQGLLATDDFSRYTCNEPVVRTALGRRKLLALKKKLMKGFYSSPRRKKRLARKLEQFPELETEANYCNFEFTPRGRGY